MLSNDQSGDKHSITLSRMVTAGTGSLAEAILLVKSVVCTACVQWGYTASEVYRYDKMGEGNSEGANKRLADSPIFFKSTKM